MKKFLKEFKEFAMKGNVVDMAVGVIIGGAFGKIVTSLVNDIIMPAIGFFTGGISFSEKAWVLKDAVTEVVDGAEVVVTPELVMTWGAFVQSILDFVIIALCIFMSIKFLNGLKKQPEPEVEAPAGPTQEELLAEIRDLLKNK
ncbi:MAG: large-conductance mechanosensitive channel protein MscL [Muribaculaceae bacterium]|nr:large-conductance mechanosensitive channel protein MscL [Muribaculaceae bacterium]